MGGSAFIFDVIGQECPAAESELEFTKAFLDSHDFDLKTLRRISKTLDPEIEGKKQDLVAHIAEQSLGSVEVKQEIVEHMLLKSRRFMAFRVCTEASFTSRRDPSDLVGEVAREGWYGPMRTALDPGATWDLRSYHFSFRMKSEDPKEGISLVKIRWLCFARIAEEIASLHWQGFSLPRIDGSAPMEISRFPYWLYISNVFNELERLTKSELQEVALHDIILNTLWDKYRYDKENFNWVDQKIRAESSGISLNASSGGIVLDGDVAELEDFRGIYHLALTIRKSVQNELAKLKVPMPDPPHFDEVILRTLIKQFGPLSYQFSLTKNSGEKLFRSHAYFGFKPESSMPDKVQHLLVMSQFGSDLEQLQFLLENM